MAHCWHRHGGKDEKCVDAACGHFSRSATAGIQPPTRARTREVELKRPPTSTAAPHIFCSYIPYGGKMEQYWYIINLDKLQTLGRLDSNFSEWFCLSNVQSGIIPHLQRRLTPPSDPCPDGKPVKLDLCFPKPTQRAIDHKPRVRKRSRRYRLDYTVRSIPRQYRNLLPILA